MKNAKTGTLMGSEFKDKTVPLIVIVLLLSFVSLLVYTQIDTLINFDLYSYGLQFSREWASEYWLQFHMFIAFLGSAIVMMALTLATHYVYRRRNSKFTRWICILLPLIAAGLIAISVLLIRNIDLIVNSTLYQYGLQFDIVWAENYWVIVRVPLMLMTVAAPLYVVTSMMTWVNTGTIAIRDKSKNMRRQSSFPNSHNINKNKVSKSRKKHFALAILAIIVAAALISSFVWRNDDGAAESGAQDMNKVADEEDNSISDVTEEIDNGTDYEINDELSDLTDGDVAVSISEPHALFMGAYADYYGETLVTDTTFVGFSRLEVVELNETHAMLLMYIGVDNDFQIVCDYEDTVWKPLNEVGYEVEGMTLESVLPEEQVSFFYWGTRNCTVYEYSLIIDTEATGKTLIFLDNEFKWPLKITFEIDFEGNHVALELTLDNTNIEWLE